MQIINMQIFQMAKNVNFPKISMVFNSRVAILYLQVLHSEQYCLINRAVVAVYGSVLWYLSSSLPP